MAYGLLTPEMEEAIRPYVRGKRVWDLGAGDLVYTRVLCLLGAKAVTAVDKCIMPGCSGVASFFGTFESLAVQLVRSNHRIEVAFVSWPCNHLMYGMDTLVKRSDVVIYLGLNSEKQGTAAGGPGFWGEVTRRSLLAHVDHPRNSLLVYGLGEDSERAMHPEEKEAYRIWFPELLKKSVGGSWI
jgi:hypothetical protein